MKTGVYQIRSLVDGNRYIGSAAGRGGLNKRWIGGHLSLLRNDKHYAMHLQRAWNKYGSDSFVFEVLLYCDPQDCLLYEQIAMDHYRPEYNARPLASSCLGYRHTAIAKKNMSESKLGTRNSFYGKSHSCTTRTRIVLGRRSYNGSKNPFAKLTELDVSQIKSKLRQGETTVELARCFNVAQTTISAIKRGITWSHIA